MFEHHVPRSATWLRTDWRKKRKRRALRAKKKAGLEQWGHATPPTTRSCGYPLRVHREHHRSVPASPARSPCNFHDRRGDLPARILHKADHALKRARVGATQGRHRGREGVLEQRHHARMENDARVRWGNRAASRRGPIGSHCRRRAVGHSGSNVSGDGGDWGRGRHRRWGHKVGRRVDEAVAKSDHIFGRAAQNGLDL